MCSLFALAPTHVAQAHLEKVIEHVWKALGRLVRRQREDLQLVEADSRQAHCKLDLLAQRHVYSISIHVRVRVMRCTTWFSLMRDCWSTKLEMSSLGPGPAKMSCTVIRRASRVPNRNVDSRWFTGRRMYGSTCESGCSPLDAKRACGPRNEPGNCGSAQADGEAASATTSSCHTCSDHFELANALLVQWAELVNRFALV